MANGLISVVCLDSSYSYVRFLMIVNVKELAAESEVRAAKEARGEEAFVRLESLQQDLAAKDQELSSAREAEVSAAAAALKARDAVDALAEERDEEVSALREELLAKCEEAQALRCQVAAAESTIAGMDAARAELVEEVASLKEGLGIAEAELSKALEAAKQEHERSQERLRKELEEKWEARLKDGVGVERERVVEKEREESALRAKLSKVLLVALGPYVLGALWFNGFGKHIFCAWCHL